MGVKLSYEQVKKEFEARGYNLLEKEYTRNNVSMTFEDKNGYKAKMCLANLKCEKKPNFFYKSNPYTKENAEKFLKINSEGATLIDLDYKNEDSIARLRCACGEEFSTKWSNVLSRVYISCEECTLKSRGVSQRIDKNKVDMVCRSKGYKRISDFSLADELFEVEDKQGYKGFTSYSKLNSGKSISKYDTRINDKYFVYNLNNYAKIIGSDTVVTKLIPNKKRSNTQKIECLCGCGETFVSSKGAFLNSIKRCPICAKSISQIELAVKLWLEDNGVLFVQQYTQPKCKNKNLLRFDFYIPYDELLIEVDGEGHYKPCNFNNCSNENAILTLKETQKNDRIKNEFCKKNNLKLLRIPFWEFKDDSYKRILEKHITVQ